MMNKLLTSIKSPKDLKKINKSDLEILSYEIRRFLLENVSKTGGHLSSNLGVVELTVALHYVFDSPSDKLIWDVGHQSYVHKILTGRQEGFENLRQFEGMSGYCKHSESEHDIFEAGHASTSISAAVGMAMARDVKGEKHDVMAIIGDGSLTGGMAFEALNHAGNAKLNVKIILNDNEMSISPNVGGLSNYLSRIRITDKYRGAKEGTKNVLSNIPLVGDHLIEATHRLKDGIKHMVYDNASMFEELGFTYIGPVDGHNYDDLIESLSALKAAKGPAIIHVKTKKGHGYKKAEQNPTKYHGVGPFNLEEGVVKKKSVTYSSVFGDTMCQLTDKYHYLAVSAAMPDGTGLRGFMKQHADRFVDVGIAEQHAVTFAAGLSNAGIKPVVAIYSTFLQRAYDQVLHDVCLQNLPVVFALDRAGLVGQDGETHHGTFDISYLSALPNMRIFAPGSTDELAAMVEYAIKDQEGPIAIRYPRGGSKRKGVQADPLALEYVNKGGDTLLITFGKMSEIADDVVKRTEKVSALHLKQLKPLAMEKIINIAESYDYVITLEDNMLQGGIGEQIASCLRTKSIKNFGIDDQFVLHGAVEALHKSIGIDADSIIEYIENKRG